MHVMYTKITLEYLRASAGTPSCAVAYCGIRVEKCYGGGYWEEELVK